MRSIPTFILLLSLLAAVRADEPKGTKNPAAEPYEGFKADQVLLRKHLIHKSKNGGKDTKASSAEACEAAKRIFLASCLPVSDSEGGAGLAGRPRDHQRLQQARWQGSD